MESYVFCKFNSFYFRLKQEHNNLIYLKKRQFYTFPKRTRNDKKCSEQFLISFREKKMGTKINGYFWLLVAMGPQYIRFGNHEISLFLFRMTVNCQVSCRTVPIQFISLTTKHLKTSVRLCDAIHTIKIIFHI